MEVEVDLEELQIELLTDPDGYGYASLITAGDMVGLAMRLNEEQPGIQVSKAIVRHVELAEQLVGAEYGALAAPRQMLWNAYTLADIDMTSTPAMRAQIEGLFNGTGNTYTGLQGVWVRSGSRAEELWGTGTVIMWEQCAAALMLPPPPELTSVPDTYTPNTGLTWVAKATHIWALHPTSPLTADKGGLTLEVITTGTGVPPTALASPENTMQFNGGHETNASWYRTIGTFIWGDDPLTAGNQTPPMIGAMSCWVWFDAFTVRRGIIGGANSSGVDSNLSAQIVTEADGTVLGKTGSSGTTGYVGPLTAGEWVHLAMTNDATNIRLYVNGVKYEAAQGSVAGGDLKFNIGTNVFWSAATRNSVQGRMRLVAVVQGQTWTDAEILEQYEHPFAYYEG